MLRLMVLDHASQTEQNVSRRELTLIHLLGLRGILRKGNRRLHEVAEGKQEYNGLKPGKDLDRYRRQ